MHNMADLTATRCPAGLHAWPANLLIRDGVRLCTACAEDTDSRVMELIHNQGATLADLYRKGRQSGLLSARSDYH